MVKVCQGRITWLAITYIKNSSENQIKPNFLLSDFNKKYTMPLEGPTNENVSTDKVKSLFEMQNFYVPDLVNPIRNSADIIRHTYPTMLGKLI